MAGKRKNPGDDLFSRKAALSVSSALESLTSVFGMGTGVASPLLSPGFLRSDDVISSDPARRFASWAPSNFDRRAASNGRDGVTDPRSAQLPMGQLLKKVKPSTISTAQLHRLPDFHMPPIKQVVSLRSYPVDPVGNLISRRASHLDAFSAYPDRT
jgi:hypothetical protein